MVFDAIKKINSAVKIATAISAVKMLNDSKAIAHKKKVYPLIHELEDLIPKEKENLPRDFYFSVKSKLSTFQSAITRYEDIDKLKNLEREIKKTIDSIKKRAK